MKVERLCSTSRHVSDQLVGTQKILHHGLSRSTQQQTHTGSKPRRHVLSRPRRCAKHTSQQTELLSSQRFLALSRSFTCDGSFSDEFAGVVFKINCYRKTNIVVALGFLQIQIQKFSKIPSDTTTLSQTSISHLLHHLPDQSRNRQRESQCGC